MEAGRWRFVRRVGGRTTHRLWVLDREAAGWSRAPALRDWLVAHGEERRRLGRDKRRLAAAAGGDAAHYERGMAALLDELESAMPANR